MVFYPWEEVNPWEEEGDDVVEVIFLEVGLVEVAGLSQVEVVELDPFWEVAI